MHIDSLPYNRRFVIIEHQLIEDHKKTQTITREVHYNHDRSHGHLMKNQVDHFMDVLRIL